MVRLVQREGSFHYHPWIQGGLVEGWRAPDLGKTSRTVSFEGAGDISKDSDLAEAENERMTMKILKHSIVLIICLRLQEPTEKPAVRPGKGDAPIYFLLWPLPYFTAVAFHRLCLPFWNCSLLFSPSCYFLGLLSALRLSLIYFLSVGAPRSLSHKVLFYLKISSNFGFLWLDFIGISANKDLLRSLQTQNSWKHLGRRFHDQMSWKNEIPYPCLEE